jgi:hypothetical protein
MLGLYQAGLDRYETAWPEEEDGPQVDKGGLSRLVCGSRDVKPQFRRVRWLMNGSARRLGQPGPDPRVFGPVKRSLLV